MLPRTMFIVRTGARLRCQCKGSRNFFTTSNLLHGSGRDDDTFCGKTALVTGGASGIGFQCCKLLLACGCRGLTIVDRDNECGEVALRELAEIYGNEKAVFVNCDVAKSEHVDWAFKTTINAFNRIDIVINNAGVLNDKNWENEINTNICGTLVGSLLGLQYMAAHCVGHGGIVVNVASTMGLTPFAGCPIYSMTQSGIIGLSRALGAGCHCERTKVKVIGIVAGLTETPLMMNAIKHTINNKFSSEFKNELECHKWQKSEVVADAIIDAIRDGESGAIWVVEYGKDPYKICIPCYYDMKATGKQSIVECETPGKRSKPKVICDEDAKSKDDPKSDKKADAKNGDKPAPLACKMPCPKVMWAGDQSSKDAKTKDKKGAKTAPAKGTKAKGKTPAAKAKPLPAKTKAAPVKGKTPPAKSKAAPLTKSKAVKSKKPAAKCKTPSAKDNKAQTKAKTPPAKSKAPPPKSKASAAKSKKAPAKSKKAPPKGKKPTPKSKTPPAKSKESKGKSKAPPAKSKKTPPAKSKKAPTVKTAAKSKPMSKKICAGAENKKARTMKRDNDSECDDESMTSKSSFDCTRCDDR